MSNKKITQLVSGSATLTSVLPASDSAGTVTNKVSVQSILAAEPRWAVFLPSAPTAATGTAGNAQVALAWTAPSVLAQTPITDYVVQYSSNSGSTWTTFSDGTSTAASATVTGLTNGTAYVFRVAAVNGIGTGAYSSVVGPVTPSDGVFRAIPAMTSDTTPSGTVGLTSTFRNVAFTDKWSVFAQGGEVSWAVVPVNLCGGSGAFDAPEYAFPPGQKSLVGGYTVGVGGNSYWAGVPNWTFEGSNDSTNWTVLHTVTGETWGSAWQLKSFSLPATANYNAYRWKFTGDNTGDCSGRNFRALQLLP